MKKLLIILISILFISSNLITSCKKYVDGPAFSLLTKKARLTGNWTLQTYTYNGNDLTALFGGNFKMNIKKDGTYQTTIGTASDEGKWKFGEDKDDVYFDSNTAGVAEEAYRILRLKNKELWLRQTASNGDEEIYKLKQ